MLFQPPYGTTVGLTSIPDPQGPTSNTVPLMQGIGAIFEPAVTGDVLFLTTATVIFTGASIGESITLTPYYGVGKPPANAAAVPGSAIAIGGPITLETSNTINTSLYKHPICCVGLAVGLTAGVSYWFDMSASTLVSGVHASIDNLTMILAELL